MRIAVSGTHGLIGRAFCAWLQVAGHTAVPIQRGLRGFDWSPLAAAEAVVHLAGRNIAARWSPSFKRTMLAERAAGVQSLQAALAALPAAQRPATVVIASAIGHYGETWQPAPETAPRGAGFPAQICAVLEAGSYPPGVRVVHARLGVVLAAHGGALAKMLPAFRLGLGGPLGDGQQMMSWIALRDAVAALGHIVVTPNLHGPVNVVAPAPCPQATLARELGRVLRRPALLPMPGWAVRLLFGEMGQQLLLSSCAVSADKLTQSGFTFQYPTLPAALAAALR